MPNGLDRAEADGDGFSDYVTNYEAGGQIRVAFHPGLSDVRKRWPSIKMGRFQNAESAAFGDLDGDGNWDIVVCQGEEFSSESGVSVLWGPPKDKVKIPQA